jgi:hypothetical protein
VRTLADVIDQLLDKGLSEKHDKRYANPSLCFGCRLAHPYALLRLASASGLVVP